MASNSIRQRGLRRAWFVLIALAAALLPQVARAGQSGWALLRKDYPAIRDISFEILERFPPQDYVYVPVGGSPAPIARFIENLEVARVENLPISDMRRWKGFTKAKITPRFKRKFFNHIGRYLPDAQEMGGKKILLIDFAATGDTLRNTAALVAEYSRQAGLEAEVEAVALGRDDFRGRKLAFIRHVISLRRYPTLNENLNNDAHRWASQYDKAPWDDLPRGHLRTRQGYIELGKKLGRQMNTDPVVDRWKAAHAIHNG